MEPKNLPRLLYIGDVPVECNVAGAALIYRLLQNYPVSRLQIIQGNIFNSQPDKRLSNVVYKTFDIGSKRLLYSRLVSLYSVYLCLTAKERSHNLTKIINEFQPESILTVAHGFAWLTAAALAKDLRLPLHLIVHDDWPTCNHLPKVLQNWANRQFANVYRQARSRLCVSPYMMEEYQKRYGVVGSVLYPSRAADAIEFDHPPQRYQTRNHPLVFAYAGSINSQGYRDALISLASILETFGSQLIIYSPLNEASIQSSGLNKSNIINRTLIPYKQLISTLREEADVLFVPMNFELQHKSNMQLSFPSKLTDYTAIGLPLLVWGPPYCSAVRWAQENPGVAEVVDDENIENLSKAIKKLAERAEYRERLAKNALTKGQEHFSHVAVTHLFFQAIGQTSSFTTAKV